MRIAFFGRQFHKFSASANFFIDYIKQEFDVDLYYLDGGDAQPRADFIIERYEAIICWQNEHVATYYSIVHPNVINISMWDGVSNRSDNFFNLMSSLKNICFSRSLFDRLGGKTTDRSFLIKYYMNSSFVNKEILAIENAHRVTFWERDPGFLRASDIVDVFNPAIQNFHFHGIPAADQKKLLDEYSNISFTFTDVNAGCNNQYIDELSKSTIFVSPRRSEGIGMSFIEAMSHGLLVMGNNQATMSEYLNKNCLFVDLKSANINVLLENYFDEINEQNIRFDNGVVCYKNKMEKIKYFISEKNGKLAQLKNFPALNLADVDNSLEALELYANTYYR